MATQTTTEKVLWDRKSSRQDFKYQNGWRVAMWHWNASAVKENMKQCFMQRHLVDTTKKVRRSESSKLLPAGSLRWRCSRLFWSVWEAAGESPRTVGLLVLTSSPAAAQLWCLFTLSLTGSDGRKWQQVEAWWHQKCRGFGLELENNRRCFLTLWTLYEGFVKRKHDPTPSWGLRFSRGEDPHPHTHTVSHH